MIFNWNCIRSATNNKMWLYVYSVFILFALNFVKCRPLSNDELVTYLSKYGYTGVKEINDLSTKEKDKAIKDFQQNFLLPMTGNVNNVTEAMILRPRCGSPDELFAEARNSIQNSIWPNTTITYKFINFPKNGLSKSAILKEIAKSFDIWAEHVPLMFENKDQGDVDIEITFNAVKDGDGPGNTLAYAFYPTRGDVFFDAENWTIGSNKGFNLFLVAAHEIGHSLGLSHSKYEDALMYPYIIPYNPNFKLHHDDVNRIQELYGSKNINAAFLIQSDIFYLISGDKCMKYRNKKLQAGYPKKLTEEWPGLPSSIDAAYYYKKNIYFLKDSKAWLYDGKMKKYESEVLNHKFDAAFTVGHRLYMFSGSQYWRYNNRGGNIEIMNGFPRNISSFWKGIPSSTDAAYYDEDQYMYFFKDNLVYTFDMNTKDAEATSQTFSNWLNEK